MESQDKSLDDFFAKKDKGKKGKSKGKGKFTTASSITKQVEQSKTLVNEPSKEPKPAASQLANAQKEDEWEDFNEPKEKDYSGLKVQSLQTMDKQDDNNDDKADNADEYDEDSAERKDKSSNVWQVVSQPAVPAAAVEEGQGEAENEATTGVYVPPSRRNVDANDQSWKYRNQRDARQPLGIDSKVAATAPSKSSTQTGSEAPGVYVPPSRRKGMGNQVDANDQSWKYKRQRDPRRPPEIDSEIAFPSLQAATASGESDASSMNFESVKHGGRAVSEQSLNRRADIAVGNKFSALSK